MARERAQSFLRAEHQQRILTAYQAFTDDPGFAKVATATEILQKNGNLSIPRYVRPVAGAADDANPGGDLRSAWAEFEASGRDFWPQMDDMVQMLDDMVAEGESDG